MGTQKLSRLNARLSPEEHAAIARRASGAGLTVSGYMRRSALLDTDRPIIRTDAEQLHLDTDRPIIRTDAEQLQALYRNLRKAGGNLNQIARELNTHHRPAELQAEMLIAFRSISRASDEVSAFISDARNGI